MMLIDEFQASSGKIGSKLSIVIEGQLLQVS